MATSGPIGKAAPGAIHGTWTPPAGLDAVPEDAPVPASEREQSDTSGGTAHLLPEERARASFETLALTNFLDGGAKWTMRRRWLWAEGDKFDNAGNYYLSREALVAQHCERFLAIHRHHAEKGFQPSTWDVVVMGNAARNAGAFSLHYGAFCPTVLSQGTPEQQMEWLLPAYRMDIVGCLAQTELGHGSNVRGLQTTSTYDKATQEFVLNTPTLRAMKWWPGGLGKTATHAALYAQLIIDGKEYGVHTFILQLRDEKHVPLPGIEVGEIGPKLGDNHTETGFLRLRNVRIPRTWMLMKNQQVTEAGEYVKKDRAKKSKLMYTTMLQIRAGLVMGAGYRLAQGVTIAVRYSCVRQQGFVDTVGADSRLAPENKVLDYQVQRSRVLKQLGLSYAMVFTGKMIADRMNAIMEEIHADEGAEPDLSDLPEMHATSAGLKALCTFTAADGLEECRKCCGGHGVMLVSGVAAHTLDYTTYCTAEGDRIILELQSARYLMKAYRGALAGEKPTGACAYLAPLADRSFVASAAACPAATKAELRDFAVLETMMRHRALVRVADVGSRLQMLQDSGKSFDAAWNECAVDLVNASRAHCHVVLLSNFVKAVNGADGGVKPVLVRVCGLFALQVIEEHLGDFVGYITPAAAGAVRAAVRDLLAEIRPDAVALTDAFEFPDNVLNSALGRRDGKVYEALYEAARTSPLNSKGLDVPFDGYVHLEKYLDKDFLKEHAAMVKSGPPAPGPRSRL